MEQTKSHAVDELAVCRARIAELEANAGASDMEPMASRDLILAAVGAAATGFMLGDDLDARIRDLLRELGQAADVCRTYIFERYRLDDGSPVVSQRYEWTREGVSREIDNPALQEIPCKDPVLLPLVPRLERGDVVEGAAASFPDATRAVLEDQGIQTLILVPIFVQADWWGFIGLDACCAPRIWRAAEADALRVAAGLVGASLGRWQAEEELRSSEARFRALLENMPSVAVQGYDEQGTVRFWNRANEALYGYRADEALGRDFVELIIPADMREMVRAAIREGAQTGRMPPPAEHALQHKDGSPVSVLSSHAVVRLPNRKPELFCIDVDLTPLKAAENELRRREREFAAMAENSPDIIMRYDREHRHLYVNPAVLSVVPRSPSEWIGKTHAELGFSPDMCRYWEERIDHVFEAAVSVEEEFTLRTEAGEFILEWRLIPELDEEGRVHTVLSVARDIKASREAEQELRRSREQLRRMRTHAEHVREDEQRLIARRIHDGFGQRLTTLTMDLTWLRDRLCEPGSSEHGRVTGDLKLIEELLALARDISTELRPSVLDHFGLPAALEHAAETFQATTGLPVEVDVDDGVRLGRDAESGLYRIARELLTNVARHAQATRVRLGLQRDGDVVQLEIADDGRGMSATDEHGLNSMGLLAVRETALSLGGALLFDGGSDAGTKARVRVPSAAEPGVEA